MSAYPPEIDIDVRVRYAECDPMGFLHHAKYFEYFEMARTELLRQMGTRYRDLEERDVLFVVVKLEVRYRKPARYDDELTIKVAVARQTRARIDHRYEVYREGMLLCEASSVLACIDRTGKPIPIPDDLRVDPPKTNE